MVLNTYIDKVLHTETSISKITIDAINDLSIDLSKSKKGNTVVNFNFSKDYNCSSQTNKYSLNIFFFKLMQDKSIIESVKYEVNNFVRDIEIFEFLGTNIVLRSNGKRIVNYKDGLKKSCDIYIDFIISNFEAKDELQKVKIWRINSVDAKLPIYDNAITLETLIPYQYYEEELIESTEEIVDNWSNNEFKSFSDDSQIEVVNIENDCANQFSEISALRNQLDNSNNQFSNAQSQINSLNTNISSLQNDNYNLKKQKDLYAKKIDSLNYIAEQYALLSDSIEARIRLEKWREKNAEVVLDEAVKEFEKVRNSETLSIVEQDLALTEVVDTLLIYRKYFKAPHANSLFEIAQNYPAQISKRQLNPSLEALKAGSETFVLTKDGRTKKKKAANDIITILKDNGVLPYEDKVKNASIAYDQKDFCKAFKYYVDGEPALYDETLPVEWRNKNKYKLATLLLWNQCDLQSQYDSFRGQRGVINTYINNRKGKAIVLFKEILKDEDKMKSGTLNSKFVKLIKAQLRQARKG